MKVVSDALGACNIQGFDRVSVTSSSKCGSSGLSYACLLLRFHCSISKQFKLFLGAVIISSVFAVGAPATAKTLRIGLSELPAGYGNPFTAIGLPGTLVWLQIFDGLTKIDGSGKLAPALADNWVMVDPLTWRFRIRDNVFYSDGTPFDAEKAKVVFDWLLSDPGQATIVGNAIKGIAEVRVEGSSDLIIRTFKPDPILANRLTIVMMVEPEAWRRLGEKAYAREPIGTGSYVLRDWQNINGAAELVANTSSWRPPHIQTIEVFPLTDHAARFQAAVSRQLDATISLRPDDLDAFRRRGFDVLVDTTKQIIGLAFDVEGHAASPIANMKVRQALNYAIDKTTLSEVITDGTWPPASQGAAPNVFGFNPAVKPYPYDPDLARALLAEAGYPEGFTISASVVIGTYANDVEIYQKVQQDLADIGVELIIEATVFSDWIQQYVYAKWRTDAFSLAWNTTPYADAMRPMEYFSCKKPRPFFCEPDMMPSIDRADIELDPMKREHLLFDLQQQFHDRAPHLFLLEYGHIWVISSELSEFELHDRVPQLHKVRFGDSQ